MMVDEMKKILCVISIAVLAGCATDTGIVKITDDTYMVARQGYGWSGAPIKVELYKEANEFCAKMGKKFVQSSHGGQDATYSQYAAAEIQFKCQ
jgi:hypothetical protein